MRDLMIQNSVRPIQDLAKNGPKVENTSDGSFGKMISQAIDDVNDKMVDASKAAEELTMGKNKDIHGTMIAMEKASISFQLLTQVRNKIIDAYKEVQRMSF
jgi:flagellar hook-basal body complex protein FliE